MAFGGLSEITNFTGAPSQVFSAASSEFSLGNLLNAALGGVSAGLAGGITNLISGGSGGPPQGPTLGETIENSVGMNLPGIGRPGFLQGYTGNDGGGVPTSPFRMSATGAAIAQPFVTTRPNGKAEWFVPAGKPKTWSKVTIKKRSRCSGCGPTRRRRPR